MVSKRRWKLETQFKYLTLSGAICIQITEIVNSANIHVCKEPSTKKETVAGQK